MKSFLQSSSLNSSPIQNPDDTETLFTDSLRFLRRDRDIRQNSVDLDSRKHLDGNGLNEASRKLGKLLFEEISTKPSKSGRPDNDTIQSSKKSNKPFIAGS